jgi:hypothetical protein
MKWREPWRSTIRRQDPWTPFTRVNLRNSLIWTALLLAVGGLRAYASDVPLNDFLSRMWVAPAFGAMLTLVLSIGHWLGPLSVDSGPNGIVRSKAGALALIPWKSIQSYRICEHQGERVLELAVSYNSERERLYLAKWVDTKAIERELIANGVAAEA